MKKIYILLTLLLCTSSAYGVKNKPIRNKVNSCKLTKIALNNYEPKVFETSNNLLRKPGGSPVVCGEKVILKGRVLDKNCVPVVDAKVYIWQVGCDGKYHYVPLRTVAAEHHTNTGSGSSFTGNGTATTDNNGEFEFVTISPAGTKHGNREINLRVEHRELGSIQTQIVPKVDESDNYDFTIVMHKKSIYRKY